MKKLTVLILCFTLINTGCVSKRLQNKVYGSTAPDNNHIFGTTKGVDGIDRDFLPPRTPGPQPNLSNTRGYNRYVYDEHNELFPRLSNPTVVIHFNPSINEAQMGIPGFDTAITLYNKNHYVLPNEWYGINALRSVTEEGFVSYPGQAFQPKHDLQHKYDKRYQRDVKDASDSR